LWALANIERQAITTILTRWFANSCNKQISYHFLVTHVKAAYPNYTLCNKLFFEDFRRLVTSGSMIQTRKTTIVTDILDNVCYLRQKKTCNILENGSVSVLGKEGKVKNLL